MLPLLIYWQFFIKNVSKGLRWSVYLAPFYVPYGAGFVSVYKLSSVLRRPGNKATLAEKKLYDEVIKTLI